MSNIDLEVSAVYDFLTALNGKFFTVEFIKRSTGEVRVMRATTNFESHLKGGQATYDAKAKNLVVVLDLEALKATPDKAFRSIPAENVLTIKANGNVYTVTR